MKNVFLCLLAVFCCTSCTKKSDTAMPVAESENDPQGVVSAPIEPVAATTASVKTIRRKVTDFQKSKNENAKYVAAMSVYALGAPSGALSKDAKAEASWKEAYQLAEKVTQAVQSFELNMLPTDVEYVVQDNVNSLAKKMGKFDSFAHVKGCKKEEFDLVKSVMGSRFVASRLRSMMELAALYESGFSSTYATRAMQLIKRDDRFAGYRNDLILYYNAMRKSALESERARDKRVSRRGQIWRTKQLLNDTGLTGEPREQLLTSYVKMAPSCFGRMDSKVRGWINEAVTKSRGAYLLDRLKERAWEELTSDDLIEGDPIKGETMDAWGKPYLQNPDQQEIRSAGPDTQYSTDDDIIISNRS